MPRDFKRALEAEARTLAAARRTLEVVEVTGVAANG
jgi:hypothetical protein